MSHDTFDKSAWLRSMLYESGDRFAAAVADQVELVRNEAEAEAAFWRAMRFPDVVSKLTYDYDADVSMPTSGGTLTRSSEPLGPSGPSKRAAA